MPDRTRRRRCGKRAFDLLWSVLGLLLLWPVFLLVAVLVKLEDGGPIFFRQERAGLGGERFRMWKFRTMVPDAERRGIPLTVGEDPRITRVGFWLRKLKLDELPQLFNVVVGEMSLVGPRPEPLKYAALYTLEQRQVFDFIPGITDPSAIKYRNESDLLARAEDPERIYLEVILPDKIRIKTEYGARATVWTDFVVILETLFGRRRSRQAVPALPEISLPAIDEDFPAAHAEATLAAPDPRNAG